MSKLIKSNYVRALDSVIKRKDMHASSEEDLGIAEDNELSEEELNLRIEILIEHAQKEAEEIINKAKESAEELVNQAYEEKENILQETYEKAQQILEENRQNGYDDGYDNGYKEGKLESDGLIEEALEVKKEYYELKSNLIKQMEVEAIEMITECNEKALGKLLEEDKEKIIGIVSAAVSEMTNNTKLIVMVSELDYEILELSKNRIMAMFPLIENLEIKTDFSLIKGDCIIEGDRGSIDNSASMQIDAMNNLIKNLLNGE